MADIRKVLSRFTRDLLSYNEQLIRVGRRNFERKDFDLDYIVIDESEGDKISHAETFDSSNDQIKYTDNYRSPMTLDFYGLNGRSNAYSWVSQLSTQRSTELQKTYGITVLSPSRVINVGALTGTDYGNRYQVNLNVWHNEEYQEETLSIDTAQIDIYNNGNRNTITNIEVQ